jgi:pyridoxamine 5'-phosphate oxidase
MTGSEHPDPLALFREDRASARAREDPCAELCWMATVDGTGLPHVRTIILRDLGERFGLFINATSPKWAHLEHAPAVEVVTFYPTLNVQYRLRGESTPIGRERMAENWANRPFGGQRLDWYYDSNQAQSTPIRSREHLVSGLEQEGQRMNGKGPPPSVNGIYLDPVQIERLDLNDPNRIHDRRRYEHTGEGWICSILVP